MAGHSPSIFLAIRKAAVDAAYSRLFSISKSVSLSVSGVSKVLSESCANKDCTLENLNLDLLSFLMINLTEALQRTQTPSNMTIGLSMNEEQTKCPVV
jgi:hypothetical protein